MADRSVPSLAEKGGVGMKIVLMGFFSLALAVMLFVTIQASLGEDLFTAVDELWPDPWFRATLADAYLGFLTVFVWIAYRERSLGRCLAWLVALLLLGNIAIAIYFLAALLRLRNGDIKTLFEPVRDRGVRD